jgi:hypothetical protein
MRLFVADAGVGVRRLVGRVAGFSLLPLLGLFVPFLLLPLISAQVGEAGLGSVLAGQTLGNFGGAIVLWGWNVEGPIIVARTTDVIERGTAYASSIRTRLFLLPPVAVACSFIAWLVAAPDFRIAAIAMTLANLMALGLNPSWYGIGVGQPRLLAWFDSLPRALATLTAAPLIPLTHSIWPYPITMALCLGLSLVILHRRVAPGMRWQPWTSGVGRELRVQTHTAGINLSVQAYASAPTPIATATMAPGLSASLGLTDTMYRLGLTAVVVFGNAFQAWVLEPRIPDRRARQSLAVFAHIVLGVVGLGLLLVAGPPVSALLSHGEGRSTIDLCMWYGIAFVFISASTPLQRNLLIPAGKQRLVLLSTIGAAALGLVMMVSAGLLGFVNGIAMGMAFSEILLFMVLAVPSIRLLRAIPR